MTLWDGLKVFLTSPAFILAQLVSQFLGSFSSSVLGLPWFIGPISGMLLGFCAGYWTVELNRLFYRWATHALQRERWLEQCRLNAKKKT